MRHDFSIGGERIVFFLLTAFIFQSLRASNADVEKIRQAIRAKGAKWTADETWVSRLPREKQKRLCGTRLGSPKLSKAKILPLPLVDNLPMAFDWRNNNGNWVTSVKDQSVPKSCGSCWDFSAIAQVESWWKIHHNNADINLSEQFILSCGNVGSCNGGSVSGALDFIRETGVPSENCFTYQADDKVLCSSACSNWPSQVVTIPGWGYITLEEALVNNIKSAVYRHPVSAGYMVYSDFLYYSGGVYEHVWGSEEGGHAILIVGWNDADSCWICKNSWSEFWGEQGYFRIKWGNCGIGENMPFVYDAVMGPSLSFSPASIDFSLHVGESAQKTLTLKNGGSGVLEFSSMDYVWDNKVTAFFHPDTFMAYDGYSWWCGDVHLGGYNNHWLQYLETPVLDLSNSANPKLSFMGFWAVEDPSSAEPPWDGWDGCNVWISTDSGKTFQVAVPETPAYNCQSLWSFGSLSEGWQLGVGIPGWGGKMADWTPVEFDLSSCKSAGTIVRFAFASDLLWCTSDEAKLYGFFVDDILISDGAAVVFQDHGDNVAVMRPKGCDIVTADWLEIRDGTGTIPPYDSTLVGVQIFAVDMQSGIYEGFIRVTSNDTTRPDCKIPVTIHIQESSPVFEGDGTGGIPKEWNLEQNYPNPFNSRTIIPYALPKPSHVDITIYNCFGQKVKTLVHGKQGQGSHKTQWDGTDSRNASVGSGLYFVRLTTDAFVKVQKVLLLK